MARTKERRECDFLGSSGTDSAKRNRVSEVREREELGYNIILRFGEEKGISSMNPVKLSVLLNNKVGEIRMAKVLKDGNLLIVCRDEKQRERAAKITEIGRSKVVSLS